MKRSERTCCICRSTGEKWSLARLVCVNGQLVWDIHQTLPGRGGYVHREARCVSKMGQPARWERVLRIPPGTLRAEELGRVVRHLLAEAFVRDVDATEIKKGEVGEASRKGGAPGKVRL